jgi:hypothetical protein
LPHDFRADPPRRCPDACTGPGTYSPRQEPNDRDFDHGGGYDNGFEHAGIIAASKKFVSETLCERLRKIRKWLL